MIPAIVVRKGGSAPITVEPTTNSLWLAEETVGDIAGASKWAVLLAIAYYGLEGEPDQAATVEQVRAWARDNHIRVDEVEEEDATQDPT